MLAVSSTYGINFVKGAHTENNIILRSEYFFMIKSLSQITEKNVIGKTSIWLVHLWHCQNQLLMPSRERSEFSKLSLVSLSLPTWLLLLSLQYIKICLFYSIFHTSSTALIPMLYSSFCSRYSVVLCSLLFASFIVARCTVRYDAVGNTCIVQ